MGRKAGLLGFSLNVKSCIAVYNISVFVVLFLLVMCIRIDLHMLKMCDFGHMKSRRVKPSQAKPTAWEACKGIPSQHPQQERTLDQSTLGQRAGWIHLQQHH